jgi:FKBP-type peptidyl-prolyl cis-trans isomerase SlyD
MKITPGAQAKLIYTLYTACDHKMIEQVSNERPVVFTFGNGQLIEGFEENLMGLSQGDKFDFVIKAEQAYGPVDSYAIFDLPKETFEVDGKLDEKLLKIGNSFPMQDNDGNRHEGVIIEIHEETVTMDFNHPLAGKDLRFVGSVVEVIPSEAK